MKMRCCNAANYCNSARVIHRLWRQAQVIHPRLISLIPHSFFGAARICIVGPELGGVELRPVSEYDTVYHLCGQYLDQVHLLR